MHGAHMWRVYCARPATVQVGFGHRSGFVAWFEVTDVAKGHPTLELVRRAAAHRFQQMPDVVTEREAVENLSGEPGCRVIEDRWGRWTEVPGAAVELVDLVAGLAAEQFHDVDMFGVKHVYCQVGGVRRHSERVVLRGQSAQKPGRMDAGLTGEAHQES